MIVTHIKPFGSMLKRKNVEIYDNVFAMHTKMTVAILLVFAILVSCQDFFGKPIHCKIDVKDTNLQLFVDNFCWTNGTFTYKNVSRLINGHESWQNIPEYQKYYQWIVVVLFIKAIIYRLPNDLWKGWEHGRMKQLCDNLGSVVLPKDYQEHKDKIILYLKTKQNTQHAIYFTRYIICEILNVVIVVTNMLFLNGMFNQFWIRYLPAISALIRTEGETFSSLSNEIFPKLAKCTYIYTGPSGSTQIRDAYCLLTLNILNEKIFAFLYIWLIVLLFASCCNLIAQSIFMLSSTLRLKVIQSLTTSTVPLTKKKLSVILQGDAVGDWYILYQLGKHLNPIIFNEILFDVATTDESKLTNDI